MDIDKQSDWHGDKASARLLDLIPFESFWGKKTRYVAAFTVPTAAPKAGAAPRKNGHVPFGAIRPFWGNSAL